MFNNSNTTSTCVFPELCDEQSGKGNLGLAFGLTIGAGLATTVGAMLPFIPVIRRANTIILSAGLALAAGVMLYVSFTEILGKSIANFCCITSDHSTLAAVGCFFGGVLLTVLLEFLVTGLQKLDCGWKWPWCRNRRERFLSRQGNFFRGLFKRQQASPGVAYASNGVELEENDIEERNSLSSPSTVEEEGEDSSSPADSGLVFNSEAQISQLQEEDEVLEDGKAWSTDSSEGMKGQDGGVDLDGRKMEGGNLEVEQNEEALGPVDFKEVLEKLEKDTKQLHKMGLLTALAIGLHNFPEGMATFVAALSSPSLGVALAIAIALHNVPEGLCVALPVYYATGSRWKGFLWAFLSGVSEPIGALLGWAVLKDIFGPTVFGVAFGLIAGMMVFISLKELLPMAYKFDNKQGRIVALFLALGMFVMALSLILFLY